MLKDRELNFTEKVLRVRSCGRTRRKLIRVRYIWPSCGRVFAGVHVIILYARADSAGFPSKFCKRERRIKSMQLVLCILNMCDTSPQQNLMQLARLVAVRKPVEIITYPPHHLNYLP